MRQIVPRDRCGHFFDGDAAAAEPEKAVIARLLADDFIYCDNSSKITHIRALDN